MKYTKEITEIINEIHREITSKFAMKLLTTHHISEEENEKWKYWQNRSIDLLTCQREGTKQELEEMISDIDKELIEELGEKNG